MTHIVKSIRFSSFYFVSTGLAFLFFVLQACAGRDDVVLDILRDETRMFEERALRQARPSLGEMYSQLLSLFPRWEIVSVYRQQEPLEGVNGVPIPSNERPRESYIFGRDGSGYRTSSGPPFSGTHIPFSWRFSDDGKSLIVAQNGRGVTTWHVVDLWDKFFIVDEPQVHGGYVRLVYTSRKLSWGQEIDLGRCRRLVREILRDQMRSLSLETEDLERRIRNDITAGRSKNAQKLRRILWFKSRRLQTKSSKFFLMD